MKKILLFTKLCLVVFAVLFSTHFSNAQNAPKDNQTVTFTVESKDKDGNKSIKKIVRKNENLSEAEIQKITDELVAENEGKDVKIEVNVEEQKAITSDSPQQDSKIIIRKNGKGTGDNEDVRIFIDGEMLGDTGKYSEKSLRNIFTPEMLDKLNFSMDSFIRGLDTRLKDFRESTQQPFLGVTANDRIQNGIGVEITDITEASGAEKAGLKAGDIITSIAGVYVNSFAEMSSEIKKHKPGEEIEITYTREGIPGTVKATLGQKELSILPFPEGKFDFDNFKWYGDSSPESEGRNGNRRFRFFNPENFDAEITSQQAQLGVMVESGENNQVRVTDVVEGTAAYHIGLRKGDVIEKINKERINNSDKLISTISALKPGDEIKLTYRRDGKKTTTAVILGKQKNNSRYGFAPEMNNNRKTYIFKNKNNNANVQTDAPHLNLEALQLFPNPSNGSVNISFKSDSDENVTVKVLDLEGKEIQRETIESGNGSFEKTIQIKDTKPGAYILRIEQDGKMTSEKLILNR